MKSIRVFLIVATLATLVLVVFISTVQGYRASMVEAQRLFDGQLQEQAHFAASLRTDDLSHMDRDTHAAYQLWQRVPGGEPLLLAHTGNIPGVLLANLTPGFGYANFSGYRWRTYVYFPDHGNLIVVAAARDDIRFQLAESVITEAILPIALWLPLSGLLIWLIVGRGLKPLHALAQQLRGKASHDLSPIDLPRRPVELDQVVHSVNSLLSRLQGAFEREKRFAADAAHELRTPISVLKIQLHNLAQGHPEQSAQIDQLQHGVERMQHLVAQILDLHMLTPGQLSAGFVAVDLYLSAQQAIADGYSRFADKGQAVELTGGGDRAPAPTVAGDPFALDTLIRNLLTNAGKYSPRGACIHVDVSAGAETATLVVEDSGPGIPEGERERIFERFHRVGGDRHDSGESGCGLGLAIVRNIAELHHATIAVDRSPLGGARFALTFPLLREPDTP